MKYSLKGISFFILLLITSELAAEDGYRLWLRYVPITDTTVLKQYNKIISGWKVEGGDAPMLEVCRHELKTGLEGLLGGTVPEQENIGSHGTIIAGIPESSKVIASLNLQEKLKGLGDEGYHIINTEYKVQNPKNSKKQVIIIAANSERGVLYGIFHFLRLLQTHHDIRHLNITNTPAIKIRLLNHWDNLNRTVERGYAGLSLWKWESLPDTLDMRYTDYARANASVGINGTVLTNVNANSLVLTRDYLVKVAALADVFRPYGIKVYLTARFSAPVEIGKLKTADPLDPEVIIWWGKKADEIYSLIPDFGGFLVKANSEGQPGPQNYNRTHADGANMLADVVAPHNGIVMWRAFVYDNNVPDDRAKQAYNEFVPLDGKFRENVLIQVKNGPVDFQPREPFHPLFGAMPETPVMPEFQITQEYLGSSVHLVFLAPLYEECLKSDTYARGEGSLVAGIVDGTLFNHSITAIAGVSNIGSNINWTGHPFGQANWYSFGRLAWDPYIRSEEIADEWIRMTFTNNDDIVQRISKMMLDSREMAVNYMTPLGLHHIMYAGHHYGPGPWVNRGRSDWTSVYYHRADSIGIGFDRTSKGSNAVQQYFAQVRDMYNNIETCPEGFLLWFHHVPWDYRLKAGRNLWEELCYRYDNGVKSVRWLQDEWDKTEAYIDRERFVKVQELLAKQERDAKIWRDGCLLYFQTYSKKLFPEYVEKPEHDLEYYKKYRYSDIPGIR